jgi:acetoin utilization deacetylase AcuC-like enzyme
VIAVYSDRYHIDLGGHVYPTEKYHRVYRAALERGLLTPVDVLEPCEASWDELSLVHTADYLSKVRNGTLSIDERFQLELPWSPELVECFRLMTGGTIVAARTAMSAGGPGAIVLHVGGGLHHAFPDHGEGFCVFNDVAVAIRVLQRERLASRAAVIDCDVHHGNGTAFIFAGDPSVFTFSMHQERNYPSVKPPGSLDIGLADGTGDGAYLSALEAALPKVFEHRPDVVFYLAGADPFEEDQLGGLRLTFDGLRARDRMVVAASCDRAAPLVVTLAGGYARRVEDTVGVHLATLEELLSGVRAASGRTPS